MTQEKTRQQLADLHGQQVQVVSSRWIEDEQGNPQAVERVVESAVLYIPDCLRNDEDSEDELLA